MIPLSLRLDHFLSYRQAVLDFRGLHTACVCGANGAGKSSLLEAMTWVLWGQSRAVLEDDVIHLGADEVQVDFTFIYRGQLYRVLRRRHRKQSTVLEFQVGRRNGALAECAIAKTSGLDAGATETTNWAEISLEAVEFRSLTAKGVRATQQRIVETLKLDYETFVNSAYLRQGRADEFMLKRPSERKQVLASLMKLDQYDSLAEQARERSRDFKVQAAGLEQATGQLVNQLELLPMVIAELKTVTASLAALRVDQTQDQRRRDALQVAQRQRQDWQQQIEQRTEQRDRLHHSQAELQQRLAQQVQTQEAQRLLLAQGESIEQSYAQWCELQQQDERLAQMAEQHRGLMAELERLKPRLEQQSQHQAKNLAQCEARFATLNQQLESLQPLLQKAPEITEAQRKLKAARSRLRELDQLQADVMPVQRRQGELQQRLDRLRSQMLAQIHSLQQLRQELEVKQGGLPQLEQELAELTQQVDYLEERQRIQDQIREKGMERRSFLERLLAHRQDYEAQIAGLDDEVRSLDQPDASCPLCDRPLDEKHFQMVHQRYELDRQEALDLLVVVRDQVLTSQREIEVLREEYRAIERERAGYGGFLEHRGQLQEQIAHGRAVRSRLDEVASELTALQQQVELEQIEPELQQELAALERQLGQLTYDERNHALARGEAERWRWADIKQGELRQALKRQQQLIEQLTELGSQRVELEEERVALQDSPAQQQLQMLEQQLGELAYDADAHAQLRRDLREGQGAQMQYQALAQAREQQPKLEQEREGLMEQQAVLEQEWVGIAQQLESLGNQLEQSPDPAGELATLEEQITFRRQRLDQTIAEQGRLEQRQQQLEQLRMQHQEQLQQIQVYRHQQLVHQELAKAFGKNGIQALMIENLLPQLEQETNRILSRLSEHQLQVQFITQKAKRSVKASAKKRGNGAAALIDTLDIRIADARGTRPYETFSGGEAFRVNFSIRLALARLLAQRSGTALQLLIVDEGFGTQDAEGCDRLIGAINAIAPDFACILAITHMPQFKEAFQARIEVTKGAEGSQLTLAV